MVRQLVVIIGIILMLIVTIIMEKEMETTIVEENVWSSCSHGGGTRERHT